MLKKLKNLLFRKKKSKFKEDEFVRKIVDKYTTQISYPYYESLFTYFKFSSLKNNYYKKSVLHQEIVKLQSDKEKLLNEVRISKVSLKNELFSYIQKNNYNNKLIYEKRIKNELFIPYNLRNNYIVNKIILNEIKAEKNFLNNLINQYNKHSYNMYIHKHEKDKKYNFEDFMQLFNSISFNNWDTFQRILKEKYITYPSVIPYVYSNELMQRYNNVNHDASYHMQKLIFIQRKADKENEDSLTIELTKELNQVKLELNTYKETIQELDSRINIYEAIKTNNVEISKENLEGEKEGSKTIINSSDLKEITRYVFDKLQDSLSLERMRRGL